MASGSMRAISLGLLVCVPLARAEGAPRTSKGGADKPIATVLFPLRALGVPEETEAALEATLRNEVASLPEIALAAPNAVSAALDREKDADCLARLACAASAAASAGARQFVSGTVSALGDAVLVDLKLVDTRSGQELRRITHPISGRQDLLIEILHAAAVELLVPARFVGRLEVKLVESIDGHAPVAVSAADAAGAKLFIDGKFVAALPLPAPVDGLAPGQRAVRVAKDGFHDATLFVEVRFDRTTEAFVDLQRGALAGVAYLRPAQAAQSASAEVPPPLVIAQMPDPFEVPAAIQQQAPEPRAPWFKIAGFSGLALGVVSATVGLVLHYKAYSTTSTLNQKYGANSLNASDAALYDDVDTETNAARALYVVAGALGAGGAALLLWDRHLDNQHPTVGADPLVLPNGGGVSLSGTF